MENTYIQVNLQEARMQLNDIIDQFESLDKVEFSICMEHLYHHLNTAYNCIDLDQDVCFEKASDDDFYNKMEKFPLDLF